ncbi:SEC-C motif-containing protein [Haloferula luteola]|uniref:SEC-C motif-containing protein n=1 Tax=Haloferula luteola TaxID=595692 RepID=A0A840V5S7_9BACT|nr:SEC-C motif-containing protein [Haloferula luteola]
MSKSTGKPVRPRYEGACPCKSGRSYETCCMPYHHSKAKPSTAEMLMRSRYSAYYFRLTGYLVETTHPDTRVPGLRKEIESTIHQVNWAGLEILGTAKGEREDKTGKVEFVAHYFVQGEPQELHEVSRFRRYKGDWKYLDSRD